MSQKGNLQLPDRPSFYKSFRKKIELTNAKITLAR